MTYSALTFDQRRALWAALEAAGSQLHEGHLEGGGFLVAVGRRALGATIQAMEAWGFYPGRLYTFPLGTDRPASRASASRQHANRRAGLQLAVSALLPCRGDRMTRRDYLLMTPAQAGATEDAIREARTLAAYIRMLARSRRHRPNDAICAQAERLHAALVAMDATALAQAEQERRRA